jgi:hypothetical protein
VDLQTRRAIPLLFAGLSWACADTALRAPLTPAPSPLPPSPVATSSPAPLVPPPSQPWFSCNLPGDAGPSVEGFVTENTGDGSRAVGGATVELFHGGEGDVDDALTRGLVKAVVTRADGRYVMCLPLTDAPSGVTGPAGEIFVVRVRKDGYRDTSHAFRRRYSVWDYDSTPVDLTIVRN